MKTYLQARSLRFLYLFPIPLIWIVLLQLGALQVLENLVMDLRFTVRGSIETPEAPIVYVNLDEQAVIRWGDDLFPRRVHAEAADALLDRGKASALFFDFIFSPISVREMVPLELIHANDTALAEVIHKYGDRVVMASAYTGIRPPYMDIPADLPLVADDRYSPELNPVPEMPAYPIYNPIGGGFSAEAWGRTGLINIAYVKASGGVTRWLPLFVDVENDYFSRAYIAGLYEALLRDPAMQEMAKGLQIQEGADAFHLRSVEGYDLESVPRHVPRRFLAAPLEVLLAMNGAGDALDATEVTSRQLSLKKGEMLLHQIPLTDGQLLEINWFSPWENPPSPDRLHYQRMTEAELRAELENQPEAVQEAILLMDGAEHGLADPYNPKVSLLTVHRMQELSTVSEETRILVDDWFQRHFEGRIVLIGPTDPIIQDVGPTPIDPANVPRVSAHGNALKTILTGTFIHHLPAWLVAVITLLLCGIVTELACVSGSRSRMGKLSAVFLLAGYVALAFTLFTLWHFVLPLIAPVGAAISTSIAGLSLQLLEEEKRRGRIKGMFSTYLAPELVDQMVESGVEPRLGGQTVEITALFSDIQNFSTFSEVLRPEELVELMNEYLTAMTQIIQGRGATLDKYIGDAIVAMFGAPIPLPDHAYRACVAAACMQTRQAELRRLWMEQGARWPQIVHQMHTRIGLNTGTATVGNMGSETRFNYTMMGDTVNLAARCESGARSAGVYTLITRATRDAALLHGSEVLFRYVDKWQVKGRSQPVSMYEILGLEGSTSSAIITCRDIYEEALGLYFDRRFSDAIPLLERAAELEPNHPSRSMSPTCPSLVLLSRCRQLMDSPPPEDWDGVFRMTTK